MTTPWVGFCGVAGLRGEGEAGWGGGGGGADSSCCCLVAAVSVFWNRDPMDTSIVVHHASRPLSLSRDCCIINSKPSKRFVRSSSVVIIRAPNFVVRFFGASLNWMRKKIRQNPPPKPCSDTNCHALELSDTWKE